MFRSAIAMCIAITLGGCATVGSTISDIAVATTSATPSQAKTVAEAIQATALVEKSLDLYVTTPSPNVAVLQELKIIVPAVHKALVAVEVANSAGNSALTAAALAAFNEALAAVQSYESLKGISQS